MRRLSKLQLYNSDLFSFFVGISRWGGDALTSDIYCFCHSKQWAIVNLSLLLFRLKKIVYITNFSSFHRGVCLTIFQNRLKKKYKSILFRKKSFVLNFYIMFVNRLRSFFSNFSFYIKHRQLYKSETNYFSRRFPTLVFLTRHVLHEFPYFSATFLRYRIICLRSNSFIDTFLNCGYNIWLNDCDSLFQLLRAIYCFNNVLKEKW